MMTFVAISINWDKNVSSTRVQKCLVRNLVPQVRVCVMYDQQQFHWSWYCILGTCCAESLLRNHVIIWWPPPPVIFCNRLANPPATLRGLLNILMFPKMNHFHTIAWCKFSLHCMPVLFNLVENDPVRRRHYFKFFSMSWMESFNYLKENLWNHYKCKVERLQVCAHAQTL